MSVLVTLTVVALAATFLVGSGFIIVMTMQRLIRTNGVRFPRILIAMAYCWLVVGGLADIVFNWLCGSWIFRELPREWTFTARCKRHVAGRGWRQRKALYWADVLNSIDPGHVKEFWCGE